MKSRYGDGVTFVVSVVIFCLFFVSVLDAAPVSEQRAQNLVKGWLRQNAAPLDTPLGQSIDSVDTYMDDQQEVVYYVVNLSPSGFVIVSPDDEVEPIIAFSSGSNFDSSNKNPLAAMVNQDIPSRLAEIRVPGKYKATGQPSKQKQKWDRLVAKGLQNSGSEIKLLGLSSISDVRVAPLIQSRWNQEDESGNLCYNYYTPSNHPCGCVATAMAQLMRYYQYPISGIGFQMFEIFEDGVSRNAWTRGGNGAGGPYNWADMPLDPDGTTDIVQRAAIGTLCYDAGVAVHMDYASGGSGAFMSDADTAMVDVFQYSNSIFGWNNNDILHAPVPQFLDMVNTNLDTGKPVIWGIVESGEEYGHAVLADGYGYNNSTFYYHLNMGWGGSDDAWYTPGNIDSNPSFNMVDSCVYNVYINGAGEIVSGRVTDSGGTPILDATITILDGQTVIDETQTNNKGIYSFSNLDPNTTFTITAEKFPYTFTSQQATTGFSEDWEDISGNVWGVDFASSGTVPPQAFDIEATITDANDVLISLAVIDDGQPGPLAYRILSLPEHGKLVDPNVGEITDVPYTLIDADHQVLYIPCAYYQGEDLFEYLADDGGIAPDGGPSNIATVTIQIDRSSETITGEGENLTTRPLLAANYEARTQVIYLSDEIGSAKTLTALALNVTSPPNVDLIDWTIRLMYTDMTEYTSENDEFINAGWTVVYQADETITSGWHTFQFQSPFAYNGTDNLLIDFTFNNSSRNTSGNVKATNAGASRVLYQFNSFSNEVYGDPLEWTMVLFGGFSWTDQYVPNLRVYGSNLPAPLPGDVNCDCLVDMEDMDALSASWMASQGQPNFNEKCDLHRDDQITLEDLGIIAENWLREYGVCPIIGDVTGDCKVDLVDLEVMARAWMTQQADPDYNESCDISRTDDNIINLSDLEELTQDWLKELEI